MSNQRPGKLQSRPEMGMTQEMGTLKFFKLAQKVLEKEDIAAEADTSCNAQVYDTDLGYTGAVTFGSNWCYFSQIKSIVKRKADDLE